MALKPVPRHETLLLQGNQCLGQDAGTARMVVWPGWQARETAHAFRKAHLDRAHVSQRPPRIPEFQARRASRNVVDLG